MLYFFTYAFIGYVCEVIYCSIPKKKFVNRGYLYAPICPIYGYGAVIVILCFDWLTKYPWGFVLVAIGGMLLTSLLEYLTSFVMEKIFHMRWWDYSNHKFNIKG
ncbi:MAG: putative ABC transporter permease [Clostridium sp.]|nr:MAG: putative ABC transporter permease [Clostridium sp.]